MPFQMGCEESVTPNGGGQYLRFYNDNDTHALYDEKGYEADAFTE